MELFRAIVNFGRKHGYILRDHAEDLVNAVEMFPKVERTRRLSADEVRAFFTALNTEQHANFRDFLSLLLFTGARRTNVLAMRWAELDLEAGTWEIPGAKAKAGQPMVTALSSGALQVLRRREQAAPESAEWVFPADDAASGHMEAPKKPWAAFRKRAGLLDVHMHDIRRTLGSWMIDTGAPIAVIGKQLGHRDAKSTAIYARLDLEPVRLAVDRAERALRRAAERQPASRVASLNRTTKGK
jgi:integrase